MLFPAAWLLFLMTSGIASDSIQFSLPVAWGFTIGTVVACGVLRYAVRGWWHLLTLPLWVFLLMNVFVLWWWNV